MDELRGVALQFSRVALKQGLETLPRLGPILPQKWNLRQIEARIPKFRIGRERLLQSRFGLIVTRLAHQNDAAQILRFRQVGLPGIDRIELLQGLGIIVGVKFAERLVVHRLKLCFGRGDIICRKGAKNQDRDRREFPNVHARTYTSFDRKK